MKNISTKALLLCLPIFATNLCGAQTVPTPDHVIVLVYENYAYSQIYGASAAPHLNALANDPNSANFTQCYAIEHPSQPNYLDMFSGANQGVTDDNVPASHFTTDNLASQLIAASKTFISYSETMPSAGFDGASYGAYVRKHNPVANWMGTGAHQVPTSLNVPFTSFPSSSNYSSLPTVCYVMPNQTNDMHDGAAPTNITLGDNWYYNNLNALAQWVMNNNSLLIVTFDEDDDYHNNQIFTVFYGPMVKGGQYNEHVNLFNLLRTMEDMYSLPHAGAAATSTAITDCWLTSAVPTVNNTPSLSFYPNPCTNALHVYGDIENGIQVSVYNSCGAFMGRYNLNQNNKLINTSEFADGLYFYNVCSENGANTGGKFIVKH